jgi:hypothetical protein
MDLHRAEDGYMCEIVLKCPCFLLLSTERICSTESKGSRTMVYPDAVVMVLGTVETAYLWSTHPGHLSQRSDSKAQAYHIVLH